ncbi:MAG: hypothetical protein A2566_03295 [Candidatus Zambryskibacteria bacterium RIFOXYD1_FULL_40_13]|nr:MAG: hypothetical protein UT25_C0002G0030 [Parcubacteria group bacterium GW2011_GWC1_39_12]KKR19471.1 MAG: hypothetical protein UT49_C0002G0317 [Parcubacteria group bacterium GW2011_GWF1_39_37]KKR35097.1 MAG: hypothetical protein UT68_C0005G0046 [Parcubacteria group bacterium GW2011_GWC2_40_10]KKR52420.1 MAG: hypothetical protein UT89_C0002G0221 [Parcubacteria group bacterium GW2011_GWE1_40_20]KKR69484.1 MAG: hypothetical protein UU11_C0001G0070 [Parcubacteria group bacterium GW2011_GWF2_40_
MDDDELDPREPKDEDDFEDDLLVGSSKLKKQKGVDGGDSPVDDGVESLDLLAESENDPLLEDSFDDDGADQW